MQAMTSRERMLRALRLQQADHVPCSFMSFTALRRRCGEDLYELAKAERAMGLDSFLFIPSLPRRLRPDHPDLRGLPVRLDGSVRVMEWREESPANDPVLHKEYITPAGKLTTSVRISEDWPHRLAYSLPGRLPGSPRHQAVDNRWRGFGSSAAHADAALSGRRVGL